MWLKIEADLDSKYRITWGGRTTQFPHAISVDAQALRQEADAMRALLASLSDWCATDDPAPRVAKLTQIAAIGGRLRFLLFNDPGKLDVVRKLETWIADQYEEGDHDLSIQPDSSIYIPWGLVYDGKPKTGDVEGESLAEREIKQFGGFWALKYSLTATGFFLNKSSAKRPRTKFGVLSLVDAQVEQQIEADLGHDEYRRYREVLSPPVGTGSNLSYCQELVEKSPQRDILFHFLGHHHDGILDLGNPDDNVDYVRFAMFLNAISERKGSDPSACGLVFLNGCESALGKEGMSLRGLSARPDLCGMIATEGIVRSTFAAKFGSRLLRALVAEGKTVAKTMDELHRDPALWPESLLYGCYAHPDYCIDKAA
jgi:hypothetical protein